MLHNGHRERIVRGLPIGPRGVMFHVRVQRYKCAGCGTDWWRDVPFVKGNRSYSVRFARYACELLKVGTIRDVAKLLGVSWDTVKCIHKEYLAPRYSNPSLKSVRHIGIDEFAVRRGHVYKTIVVDMETGRIVHVGEGKGKEALVPFWEKVRRKKVRIQSVSTDLSAAFVASVMENAPQAKIVFDRFHVVKLMNDVVDEIRRKEYAMEKNLDKRKVIKGTRWLLLARGKDDMDETCRTRLEKALSLNKRIAAAYYLKEQLSLIWQQKDKEEAEEMLYDWARQARESKSVPLLRIANTLLAHRTGILAWYDCKTTNARVEGINNKIKVMKRVAYGYRDDGYFTLRLLALHDARITQNVG